MRFLSPLSGIGHVNLPVAPIAHIRRTRAAAAASGGEAASRIPSMRFAASLLGSRNTQAGSSAGLTVIQFTTRSLSRQKPIGSSSTSFRVRRG